MRYLILVALFILLIPSATAAEENSEPPEKQLAKYHENITGDSDIETIELKGKLIAPDSEYYAGIWAAISNQDDQEWKIPFEGGYEPQIHFYDLNHDGVKDIFYQSAAGDSGGLYHYHLHTLKNKKLEEIALPKQEFLKAEFKNNFKVEIQINHEQEPDIVDVKDRSSEYVSLGIYNEDGDLLDETPPMIAPIAYFEPVKVSERKGYGMKSYQKISGAYQADQLGTVETLWYYEKDQWIILKTEWVPSE